MITEKTVRILGAGASQPYKFPLGKILANQICTNLKKTDDGKLTRAISTLKEIGFSLEEIYKFKILY